jgi:enoyl-CoA hydratase/carnithine racemase
MSYNTILFESSNKIATITLNKPDKMNAFSLEMLQELFDALEKVEKDNNVLVSIVTGAGEAFCAGMDLSSGGDTFDSSKRKEAPASSEQRSFNTLKRYMGLKKPVVAAINGHAVGVGVTMTLPFDMRIAAEGAKIGLIFNRRGVLPELGCPFFLPRIIGISKAAELMYTGRILSAREALDYGLVSRVVPDDQIMSAAIELAREIVDNCAPVSVALTKAMLWQFLFETDVEKIDRINSLYFAWSGQQPDSKEGVSSFLEKRSPEWKMSVPKDLPDFFPLD